MAQLTQWEITLSYESGADFVTRESAPTLPKAIEQAMRYAMACGWGIPKKRKAREIIKEES
jgi:hypothetical protein